MDYHVSHADHCRVTGVSTQSNIAALRFREAGRPQLLAAHPQSGAIMQGTGGIRKLRWALGRKGKSGGVRVIYYYHNEAIPLFLLTVFGKSDRANLSKSERNELAKLTNILAKNYGGKNV